MSGQNPIRECAYLEPGMVGRLLPRERPSVQVAGIIIVLGTHTWQVLPP